MRWIFELPSVTFDRAWQLGRVVFRPPGDAAREVAGSGEQVHVHTSWAVAHEIAVDLGTRWSESSTVEFLSDSRDDAQQAISEALAVLRFLMREVVTVNVDIHRIGLVGEVDRAVREYLVIFDNDRIAPGWTLVDNPVPFRFTERVLTGWDHDDRVRWLSDELARSVDERSLSGSRAITSLIALDRAFLSTDAVVRVVLYAVSVEVLLCDLHDATADSPTRTSSLGIASRVAYLTCGNGCAVNKPACPYVLGFQGQKQLWATAEQWASTGEEWRCSAFLDISRPPGMDAYFKRPSLFGARNEAVHQGRTSLDETDIRWMRTYADRAIRSFLVWIVDRPGATVSELDAEIAVGAKKLGTVKPAER